MADILQTMFKCIFFHKTYDISNKTSLKFVPMGPADNKSESIDAMTLRRQVIAWNIDDQRQWLHMASLS